ncbi:MAG: lamin tail domain-containing protein [Ignavibacteriales bacterium]|nr:lamin tail domain-containing protein [Ignavibacteriales bacterium]
MRFSLFLIFIIICSDVYGQITQFPHLQNFDSVAPPALPIQWTTTTNKSVTGDFTTTKSSPYSDSNAAISTNSTISQSLISPLIDFSDKQADTLKFYERRSSSHNSGLLIEASTNGGTTYDIPISDTLKNPGTTSYVLRKFRLPPSLDNQSNVKFRWRVIGNGTGTSGTIRFDDICISALYNTDATVSQIIFEPLFPTIGDSISISAVIKNAGIQPIQNISVEFYEDNNHDSIPQPLELFSTSIVTQLLHPNDTASVQTYLRDLKLGNEFIFVKIVLPDDQNSANDLGKKILSVGIPQYSIIINEIMFAPYSPEPEWIELYNNYSDTVDLNEWNISNRYSSTKHIITNQNILLPPGGYCVITKDINLFTAVHPDIPAPILQVISLPTYFLNNTGDAVVLFDHRGAIMDSVYYFPSWNDSAGNSLERIESKLHSNDSTNWGSSKDSLGSTPGFQNYLTPLEFDLSIANAYAVDSTTIRVVVRNAGHQTAQNFSTSLYFDSNNDSLADPSELISTDQITSPLIFKDSFSIDFAWNNPPSGKKMLISVLDYSPDQRLSDNTIIFEIKNRFARNTIVINEIMYQPKTGDAEYVELLNNGCDSVDLFEWRLTDFKDTNLSKKYVISNSSFVIGSGEFLVIAFDSSIYNRFSYLRDSNYKVIIKDGCLSLNNDGDNIILSDLTGEIIDSVHYFSSWHNPDIEDVEERSLERINPNLSSTDRRNWSTSASSLGGSPGLNNSLYITSVPNDATISFSNNPFSPDGDGFEDATIIHYELPATTATIRIRIFDSVGRLVRVLAENEPSGSLGDIIWDGYNDNRNRVRVGIYVVLLEALDGFGGSAKSAKAAVVVAAKL